MSSRTYTVNGNGNCCCGGPPSCTLCGYTGDGIPGGGTATYCVQLTMLSGCWIEHDRPDFPNPYRTPFNWPGSQPGQVPAFGNVLWDDNPDGCPNVYNVDGICVGNSAHLTVGVTGAWCDCQSACERMLGSSYYSCDTLLAGVPPELFVCCYPVVPDEPICDEAGFVQQRFVWTTPLGVWEYIVYRAGSGGCAAGPPYPPGGMGMLSAPTPPTSSTSSRAVVTMAVGDRGRNLLAVSGDHLKKYAARCGAEFRVIEGRLKTKEFALAQKFRVRDLYEEFDRILFLDADIALAPGTPNLFDLVPEGTIGIHDDFPHLKLRDWLPAQYAALLASQGDTGPLPTTCYNTGVVLADKIHADIWTPPALPYPVTHCSEQNWVNINIMRKGYPITSLGREWNYQWWGDRSMTGPAYVYHYADAPSGQRPGLIKTKLKKLYGDCGCGKKMSQK